MIGIDYKLRGYISINDSLFGQLAVMHESNTGEGINPVSMTSLEVIVAFDYFVDHDFVLSSLGESVNHLNREVGLLHLLLLQLI